MKNVFVIDSNALIDAAKNYNMAKATFSPIWNVLDKMIDNGELITSSEILEELKDDDLTSWAKKHKDFSVPLTKEIQEQVTAVLKQYPTLIKMKSTANSNGDPFLIATAIVYNGSIVSNERPGNEKTGDYHIPNVCKGLGITCMNLSTFLDAIIQ